MWKAKNFGNSRFSLARTQKPTRHALLIYNNYFEWILIKQNPKIPVKQGTNGSQGCVCAERVGGNGSTKHPSEIELFFKMSLEIKKVGGVTFFAGR